MPELFKRPRNRSVDSHRLPSFSEKPSHFALSEEEKKEKLNDPCDPLTHPLKKKQRRYLRVHSVPRSHQQQESFEKFKPLTYEDVERMKEQDLQVKLCDMGNACYVDKHYSDII